MNSRFHRAIPGRLIAYGSCAASGISHPFSRPSRARAQCCRPPSPPFRAGLAWTVQPLTAASHLNFDDQQRVMAERGASRAVRDKRHSDAQLIPTTNFAKPNSATPGANHGVKDGGSYMADSTGFRETHPRNLVLTTVLRIVDHIWPMAHAS